MSRPPLIRMIDGWKYRRVEPVGRPTKQPIVENGVNKWRCAYCGKNKIASEFYHDKNAANGLKSWCIRCCKDAAADRKRGGIA